MTAKPAPVPAAVASRVRDHARSLTSGASSGRDAALIRQATGEPQPMSKGELIDLIRRAGQTPEDFDREAAALRACIEARRLLAGRTRADIERHDAKLAEDHAAAMVEVDRIVAEVDAKHAALKQAADEAAEAESQYRIARAKIGNPRATDDERAEAQRVLDAVDGLDPAPVAHRAHCELVAYAANEYDLNQRRNAAISAANVGAGVYGEWRNALPQLHKALDTIENAEPRIAGLAARVADPAPEPKPTPEQDREAWAKRAREHRQEVESIQTHLAGHGKRTKH